ncbi:MAG: DUF523 domain-containing protein [Erysipelotrichaceae bacterium]|nr:DUF523 domain-containing protein [Erysipelotrichaceae bacterium]
MIVISACLLGENCKYDGKNNLKEKLLELDNVVSVCPEVLGGLSIPRDSCEIISDRVITVNNVDVTNEFYLGAQKALEICIENGVDFAILKANSPSCGCNGIYDGTFTHTIIEGDGIFTRMLKENNIECVDEKTYLKEE